MLTQGLRHRRIGKTNSSTFFSRSALAGTSILCTCGSGVLAPAGNLLIVRLNDYSLSFQPFRRKKGAPKPFAYSCAVVQGGRKPAWPYRDQSMRDNLAAAPAIPETYQLPEYQRKRDQASRGDTARASRSDQLR